MMGSRYLFSFLLVLFLFLPGGSVEGLTLTVDTEIPEYILDDYLNLTGTTEVLTHQWKENARGHFNGGTLANVTIEGSPGEVTLTPDLDIKILNGGNGVLQGGASAWDKYILDQVVVKVGGTYYMYYTGGTTFSALGKYAMMSPYHIGVATSSDGLSWTRYSGNPILSARVDSYDYTNLMYPVVLVENGTFHLYYAGNVGNTSPSQLQDLNICYANSTDGFNFTKYASNPVLKHGSPNTAWNGIDIRPTSIRRDFDGKLRMYFKATGRLQPSNMGGATSSDFKTWTLLADKNLYTSSSTGWEDGVTNYNHLETHNGTYRMWTHADKTTWAVGWIWSDDGMNWTDSGSAVISPTAGTIYSNDVENPSIVDEGDHLKIYTTCWDGSGNRRVACFEAKTVKLDGTFSSGVKDLEAVADLHKAVVDISAPSGSEVRVFLRWSNDSITWTGWKELGGTWSPEGVSAQYVQYKAEFRSERDWLVPVLKSFSLDYSFPVMDVEVRRPVVCQREPDRRRLRHRGEGE
jgi:hypothetical protein